MGQRSLSILPILGIIFVTLKLMGYIDWSWWLVTLPFYVAFAAAIFVVGVCVFLQALLNKGKK
jgi:hypothetical protein